MKLIYEEARMEIIEFQQDDVIRTSNGELDHEYSGSGETGDVSEFF